MPVISIIDDDDAVRFGVESLVRSLGFVARTFSSAEEYLHSSDRDETSCLISDIQMPNMSGLELQGLLAERGDRTPIMFITAFADKRVETQAMRAGAACFLIKPFSANALVEGLQAALSRKSGTTDLD